MKTSDEFRNEVYLRADKKRNEIKRRRKIAFTLVPCIAVALALSVLSLPAFIGAKSEDVADECASEVATQNEAAEIFPDNGIYETQLYEAEAIPKPNAEAETGAQKPEHNAPVASICNFKLQPKSKIEKTKAFIINSKDELNSFIKNNSDLGFDEKAKEEFDCYTEEFFKNQSLIIITACYKSEGEKESDIGLGMEHDDDFANIVVRAEQSENQADAKILFVPLRKYKINSDAKVNVTFSLKED